MESRVAPNESPAICFDLKTGCRVKQVANAINYSGFRGTGSCAGPKWFEAGLTGLTEHTRMPDRLRPWPVDAS
jgi:hypothetical protein